MKKILMTLFTALFLILFPASVSFSFDWPVEDGRLLSTFGEKHGDNFSTGITLLGDSRNVYAADAGEVIYFSVEDEWGLPSGIGNFAVIEHEGGLKTVYGHLTEDTVNSLPKEIAGNMLLGESGDSGWTYGNQLRFTVLDTDFMQIVNPLLLLPSMVDMTDPVIEELELLAGGNRIRVEDDLTVPAGSYAVTVRAYDRSEYARMWSAMSVYSLTMFLNGLQVFSVKFEALKETGDTLVLTNSGGIDASMLFRDSQRLYLGEADLLEGRTTIEIIAHDYAGNQTAFVRSFIARDSE